MDSITDLIASLGWHEWIVIAIMVMSLYFALMVLRYVQLPRATQSLNAYPPEIRTPPPEFDAPPGTALAGIWPQPVEPTIGGHPPPVDPDSFATHLESATLNVEMHHLYTKLNEARNEIHRLRDEITHLQAAQHVSPLYGEAMTLAVRGVDAAGIAGRCGVSIAEAELVVALSRSPVATSRTTEGSHGRK